MGGKLINKLVLITVLITKIYTNRGPEGRFAHQQWRCVPVKLKFCQNLNYTKTIDMASHPNPLANYENQEEIEPIIKSFDPLIKTGCSEYLKLLVCSVFVPFCDEKIQKPITACRHLCEDVKENCLKHMIQTHKKFQIQWPEKLNCSKLHERNTATTMCLDGGLSADTTTKGIVTRPDDIVRTLKRHTFKAPASLPNGNVNSNRPVKITSTQAYCNLIYARNPQNYKFVYKLQACSLSCMKDGLFRYGDKITVSRIISVLSFLCIIFCVSALLIVLFEYRNISYPARSIVYIIICYFFYSVGFIIKILYTREKISCIEENGESFLLIDGSGSTLCAATFLLTFCFHMAQNIWWIILCITWTLKVGLKYPEEFLRNKSKYFHILSWGVPCSITVSILVLRKIDVNELTGMCYVGQRLENISEMREFIIGPLFTYLTMGVTFLIFGAIFSQKQNTSSEEHSQSPKDEKSFVHFEFGSYAVVHTFFSIYILASYLYEYLNKQNWFITQTANNGPNFYVFLLRILMDFFNGIAASMWIIGLYLPTAYTKFSSKMLKNGVIIRSPQNQPVLQGMENAEEAGTSETSI